MAPVLARRYSIFAQTKKMETGTKWITPFEATSRLGVHYQIKSREGKITVVHYDRLERGSAPLNDGKVICPARELGGDQVVYNEQQLPV